MADISVSLGADASDFNATMQRVEKSLDTLSNSATSKMARFGEAFSGVQNIVATTFAGIGSIIQGTLDFVGPAAAIQRVERELKGMTGSAEEAKRIIAEIDDWGVESLYDPTALFNNAATMVKSGISSTLAPELVKELAVIAQGDQAKLDALTAALAKGSGGLDGFGPRVMKAFNVAQVDLMGAMEKTMGLSGEALSKKVKEGLSFDDVRGAIGELSKAGGPLKQSIDEAGSSWEGLLIKFGTLAENLQENFGAGLLEPLSNALQIVNAYLKSLGNEATEWGEKTGSAIVSAVQSIMDFGKQTASILSQFEHPVRALIIALSGVAAAFVVIKTGAAASFADVKISLSSISGAMTSLKVSAVSMWATFQAAGVAALTAIKSAIISTGIGALVVAIGSGLSWAYDIATRSGNSSDHATSREQRAQDNKSKTRYSNDLIENEWDQYESGMGKAQNTSEIDAIKKRLDKNIKNAEKRLAYLEEDGKLGTTDWKNAFEELDAYKQMEKQFVQRKAQALSDIDVRAKAEKERARIAKEAEEKEKQIEKNHEKLSDIKADWEKSVYDREYKKKSMDDRQVSLDFEAGKYGISPGESGITEAIASLATKSPTDEIMKQIKALEELRKKYVELTDARESYDKFESKAKKSQELLKMEIAGQTAQAQKLRDELAVTDKTESYKSAGMSDSSATAMARRDVALERFKQQKDKVGQQSLGNIIKQTGVEVGNGGKSLGLSTSMLGESKKQTKVLESIEKQIKNWDTGAVVLGA